jgi:hypothetical protein
MLRPVTAEHPPTAQAVLRRRCEVQLERGALAVPAGIPDASNSGTRSGLLRTGRGHRVMDGVLDG